MSVNTAIDREGVIVHTMDRVHGRGPVFYASLPCVTNVAVTIKDWGMRRTMDRHRLVSALCDHLAATESNIWKRCQYSGTDAFPIQVLHSRLGRPSLQLGECPGPAISFSEGGGKVWAALCGDESDLGIDVAGTYEFTMGYPFHRVFHPEELEPALRLTSGDLERASALLWSVKEAVVKALGCAFHLVDPLQITVYPSKEAARGNECYTFSVGLSGKAVMRFPLASHKNLWVRSIPHGEIWFSIALWNRRPAVHE